MPTFYLGSPFAPWEHLNNATGPLDLLVSPSLHRIDLRILTEVAPHHVALTSLHSATRGSAHGEHLANVILWQHANQWNFRSLCFVPNRSDSALHKMKVCP